MHRVRIQDLADLGYLRAFIGSDQGDVALSAYFVRAAPGQGPGPHRHPYDEIVIVQEGTGEWTVEGITFEAGPGEILVVKAGEIHGFRNIGSTTLVQLDLHLSREFVQENL